MGLFKKWRAKKAAKKQLKEQQNKDLINRVDEKPTNVKPEEKQSPTPKQTEEVIEQKKAVESKKEEETKKEETETKTEPAKEVKPVKYHVSQNKDENSQFYKKWRVRKQGSQKVIKYFDTQKEAIVYAEDLAAKAGTQIVIHKLDGSIRKQKY
ncbi:DUF2188 domain-containing protein [Haploplasma modicum]|uniref:DUF2188 domain-containing protein n=1 Tax=Haploplasma modicum TaxID=2150 RepID=UPI00214C6D62|nr:DUF2188 domain-containing protein [Haploplasma modicum]MCR1808699.1 DUF2188 domain-containing protein [Haploplasma modicum]